MKPAIRVSLAAVLLPALASVAAAQNTPSAGDSTKDTAKAQPTTPSDAKASARAKMLRQIGIQHIRANDQRGINVFESPKADNVAYDGFRLEAGAAFAQQFQGLKHSNHADVVTKKDASGNSYNANQLVAIGNGFNNADANAYLNVQLAKGIRVAMTSYLSARHHNETWVKDGYLLVDESPIDVAPLNNLFKVLTVRAGHFEINYGDQHFRRSDNGNVFFNPFVGNLAMDAMATEIGGEAYVRTHGLLAMVGTTAGESKGMVRDPQKRGWANLEKLGFDKQLTSDVRVRLTGSRYSTDKATSNTLYSGDRGGSRYYSVLDNTQSTETTNAWSGNVQPGFGKSVTAMVLNPFVKVRGLEVFGNIEQAKGRSWATTDTTDRTFTQTAGDVIYRFAGDQLYVGGRYDQVKGRFAGFSSDATVKRTQIGGGWFLTPSILTKVEYVNQKYLDFPTTDIRSGGKFHGFMVEGAVAF